MRTFRPITAVLLAGSVSACGSDDTSTMSDYTQDLSRHLDDVQTEHSTHSLEIAGAPDLDAIKRAEDDHRQRMDDHMGQMDMVKGHMMSCTDGRGAHFDGEPFAGMMHDMRSDCDDHRSAMFGAASTDAARTEESRHQDIMRDRLHEMRGQMEMMMGHGSGFSCPHGK